MFRVIVAGSRSFEDKKLCFKVLDKLFMNRKPDSIVCGCARGADALGEQYSDERGIRTDLFPACWEVYGKSAGYRRNVEMAQNAEALVAFWDGSSKGTKHMIDIASERGLQVVVFNYTTGKYLKIKG